MKKNLVLSLILILPIFIKAQQSEDKKFGIEFHGFVKTDIFYDSRQNVAIREGHFYLYPKPELLDENGKDINDKANFNILSIQTRLKGIISGPDVLGAKTSALIEGAFFGNIENDINGFRLRHAFAKLSWPKTELLIGQFWHPMFVTDCFPGTVSFNTGAPFQPFSRNPQVRLSQNIFKNFNIQLAAISQRDFRDTGPDDKSSSYLRNDVLPEMNLTIKYHKINKERGTEFLVGIGGNYKRLMPRLEATAQINDSTTVVYKTDETVFGYSGMAFFKIKVPAITIKAEGVYGQSTYSMTMLGGYAAKSWTDQTKNLYDYTPLDVISLWTDIHTNGKKWQFGIFGGYTRNNGTTNHILTNNNIRGPIYARGYDTKHNTYIDYVYRVSPRVIYNVGKMRFAGEVEYTTVGYGYDDNENYDAIDKHAIVNNPKDISNLRILLAVYYFF